MIRISECYLSPLLNQEERMDFLKQTAAKRLKIAPEAILSICLAKQSIDARKKDNVRLLCNIEVEVDNEAKLLSRCKDPKISLVQPYVYDLPQSKPLTQRPVVIGFGPAGMFAALILAQAGQKPIVIERGACVEERTKAVETFWDTGNS